MIRNRFAGNEALAVAAPVKSILMTAPPTEVMDGG
jgi:hypothetical protein